MAGGTENMLDMGMKEIIKTALREVLPELASEGNVVFVREPDPKYAHRQAFTAQEVAEIYPVAERTLEEWRRLGKGPRYTKRGRQVIYPRKALDDFFYRRAIKTVDDDRDLPHVS